MSTPIEIQTDVCCASCKRLNDIDDVTSVYVRGESAFVCGRCLDLIRVDEHEPRDEPYDQLDNPEPWWQHP